MAGVYLDNNATTPLDERVLEAMLPFLRECYGNPSSLHRFGRLARGAVDRAREQVAALVGAHPSQVVFTSGGTEANNAALKGVTWGQGAGHLLISAIEHASVLVPAQALRRLGWRVELVPPDGEGRIAPEAVAERLRADTRLVSVMSANNETGVLQDLAAIAAVVRERGDAVVHTDAVQAAGKMAVDFARGDVQLMSLSSHKIHGPKGVGALVVDKAVAWEPWQHGGAQERGRRGGTEAVAAVVGFGAAAELAMQELESRRQQLRHLRDRLEQGLREAVPQVRVFGEGAERLPNTSFVAFPGVDGETLLLGLDQQGFALSSGAACGSSDAEPSHVLQAMGIAPELARATIRISFGKENREEDVNALIGALRQQTARLAAMAASWG